MSKKYLIVFLIVLLAFALRIINLGGFEVASDEGSYAIRGIGWNDFMLSTTMTTPWNWFLGQDLPSWTQLSFFDHPPLHFASIWLSSHLFGISLWSVRLPAVIFGTLAVLMLMLICYRLNFDKIAPLTGIWLSILPWHIWISRQAQQESLLIFLILLSIYLLLNIDRKKLPYWILTGAVIGLVILTKYSAIVLAPLIIFYFFQKKWYKKTNFWILVLVILIVISPLIFYNLKMYQTRGHFDLQLARILHQDQEKDWPANVQQIAQGSLSNFFPFLFDLVKFIGIISTLIIIIGLISAILKKDKNIYLTYAMVVITALIISLTLPDNIRGSIIIPFLALSFALSLKLLPQKFKLNIILPVLAILILIPATINIFGDNLTWPAWAAESFKPADNGFMTWENWLKQNQPAQTKPIHFSSMNDWAQHQYELVLNAEKPIIIFDHRFNWFGLNWHFLRHSFYTTNYAVLHPSVMFNFLSSDPELNKILENKKIIYVEALDFDQRFKDNPDQQSELIYSIFKILIDQQKAQPQILKNNSNQEFAKVWSFNWQGIEIE
ncbi:MAG: hypothetical protein A2731_02885 [Candidatus Buchananbacteria bacterium RIFCSPHIGHO2_01_FULL_39_8]|uniref:Glycosyltransferase RgtA/B/C/D-like domain-containing protein n=1 Tax=Candidatus Buchananbacteria bacterium RIFCSPHIGHO2_01_FULL_39_8 TaxID=1797533 RepID=A0A1G1XVL5_9BACT|nr:hypothetical protein [uncultured bacterium]OGY44115.1 MAG: hypothetical protein A2731_02885 [Candidatus Buchananbacteria bacterium RIFCSPHIGHO2_01_FULL_39_8]